LMARVPLTNGCLGSGPPMWTARQSACSSPPGCTSGHTNLSSRLIVYSSTACSTILPSPHCG
jgi:hypothetical protein